jgi:hypothetical protein
MQVLLLKRQILLEFSASSVVKMDNSSFDGVILEIELFFHTFILELSDCLVFGQLLFVIDSVDEI